MRIQKLLAVIKSGIVKEKGGRGRQKGDTMKEVRIVEGEVEEPQHGLEEQDKAKSDSTSKEVGERKENEEPIGYIEDKETEKTGIRKEKDAEEEGEMGIDWSYTTRKEVSEEEPTFESDLLVILLGGGTKHTK